MAPLANPETASFRVCAGVCEICPDHQDGHDHQCTWHTVDVLEMVVLFEELQATVVKLRGKKEGGKASWRAAPSAVFPGVRLTARAESLLWNAGVDNNDKLLHFSARSLLDRNGVGERTVKVIEEAQTELRRKRGVRY